eukprot:TRINITY_DN7048_c0_g1_i1.p3 TRINITY_DN7048_c0_g1~~TRINITY_DN7048_c0_g1_i1.p3  ORF type:complete len:204 (-),score=33.67 TRINITY_DN7048_c0_g1_i1:949-1560(-)
MGKSRAERKGRRSITRVDMRECQAFHYTPGRKPHHLQVCADGTRRAFLAREFALKSEEEESDQAAREASNKEQEARIAERIRQFVMPGNPGAKFKKNFDKMLSKLELPEHIKQSMTEEVKEEKAAEITDYLSLLKGGRHHFIPSFFALIKALMSENREFAIVFRSFDTDLKAAILEFNAYLGLLIVECVKAFTYASTAQPQIP